MAWSLRLPIAPAVSKGDAIKAPYLGIYRAGEVLKVQNNQADIMLRFAGKRRIESIPLSQVAIP